MSDIIIRPSPGMQTKVLQCQATIAFIGARAGVSKTYGLLLIPPLLYKYNKAARIMVFRRRFDALTGEGGILHDARSIYLPMGARHRMSPIDFRWDLKDAGRLAVSFGALPKINDPVDKHQGHQFGGILFDELTHFHQAQFNYMRSRLTPHASAGFRPFIRATLNPIADGWIRDLVDWWIGEDGLPIREREGVIRWIIRAPDDWPTDWVVDEKEELLRRWPRSRPISFTLIPGRREDNPYRDWEAYEDQLANLEPWLRASLLEGNWNIGPEDAAKIWRLPPEALFTDDDPVFQQMIRDRTPVNLYCAWDYGRATQGLCWIVGALQPGSPPTLWIIGARVWTGASAAQAASDRTAFLENLDLDLNVGTAQDAGDPSGWARDSDLGWAETLRSHGVPLMDMRHIFTEERHEVYWNTHQGFSITTDLVQQWLNSGQLRIRQHASTKAVISAIRSWRLSVPEGAMPIEVNRAYLGPDKGLHSHPGDALRYLVAFVSMMARVSRRAAAPSSAVTAHAEAARAARLVARRGGWAP